MVPETERWKLVVITADVSDGRLVRLPWDYPLYGLDPDEQSVAAAVRASASIPFFFEPVRLRTPSGGTAVLVDGGLLSDFPVDTFDRPHGERPQAELLPKARLKHAMVLGRAFPLRHCIENALLLGARLG